MQDDNPYDPSSQSESGEARHAGRRDASGLVLVSTPIGNLGDITIRAIEILNSADLILCEDTRVTAKLLHAHGIGVRCEPLHDHNEDERTPALLARLRQGARIALVSDAGTPLVSDPGFRLMRAAIAEGIPVTAAPGANAALTALVLSGLPPHPFLFLGFAPVRQAAFGLGAGSVGGRYSPSTSEGRCSCISRWFSPGPCGSAIGARSVRRASCARSPSTGPPTTTRPFSPPTTSACAVFRM